jgi:hypothetical protein
MDRLPVEITTNIIRHFIANVRGNSESDMGNQGSPAPSLASHATVSRVWQHCIEAVTFANITLTRERLASPLVAQALTPERVCRFVRSVHVDVLLPEYDETARREIEDDNDKAANNTVFTDVVRKVFALLSPASGMCTDAINSGRDGGDGGGRGSLQQPAGVGVATTDYRPKIHLSMEALCLSDTKQLEARYLTSIRYEGSYLDLRLAAGESVQDVANNLPELHCISKFCVWDYANKLHPASSPCRGCHRHFAPRALCLLASKMSGLQKVHWVLCDNERRDVGLRKRLRAGE